MKKESCTPEKDETPELESRSHPVGFLRKATRLAEKKSGKRATGKRG